MVKDVLYTLCGKEQIFVKLWQVEYVDKTKFSGLIIIFKDEVISVHTMRECMVE